MKLWMSAEIQGDIGNEYASAEREIERKINERISSSDYGPGLIQLAYIGIILSFDDPIYHEVKKYSKRKKEAQFRLRIDYSAFKSADANGKRRLIMQSLMRAVDLLPEIGVVEIDHRQLREDIATVGSERGWL